LFGQENGVDGDNEDEGWGVAARLTYAANFGASALVHVGGAVVWEETTTTETDASEISRARRASSARPVRLFARCVNSMRSRFVNVIASIVTAIIVYK